MTGRGKGGKGDAKHHRKVLGDNIQDRMYSVGYMVAQTTI